MTTALLDRRSLLTGLLATAAGCMHWEWEPSPPAAVHLGLAARVTLWDGREFIGPVVEVNDQGFVIEVDGEPRLIRTGEILYLEIGNRVISRAGLLVTVIVLIPLALVVWFLVAVAVSSCPVLHVRDPDGRRRLLGEGYPGAVLGTLARADLVPLPDPPDGELLVDLSNHAEETQYTDELVLAYVDHPPTERVLATHDGGAIRLGAARPAARVVDLDGVDVTDLLAGESPWATDMDAATDRRPRPSEEGLVADLGEAPANAVLELEIQNSPWLDHLALQGWWALGARLDDLHRRGRDPAEADHFLTQMREAGIHLRVEVAEGGGWRTVTWSPPVGWMVSRRIAIPLDVPAGAPLRVRIRGGVGFLFVHAIGVSSGLGEAQLTLVPPASAVGPAGDERDRFVAADGNTSVLVHPQDAAALVYRPPARPEGAVRTAFLRATGWYEPHPRPEARAPVLLAVRTPDRLSQVGLGLYDQLRERLKAGIRLRPA